MRLDIKNFAKIKEAHIIVDGITVIAGENNTGKSTIGKILFSLFNAISDLDSKIMAQRSTEIEKESSKTIQSYGTKTIQSSFRNKYIVPQKIRRKINDSLKKGELDYAKVFDILGEILKETRGMETEEARQNVQDILTEKILEIIELPEERIAEEILSRYFNRVFFGEVNSLLEPQTLARLELTIKKNKIKMDFGLNKCRAFQAEVNILNKALYIANPFIIDKIRDTDDEFYNFDIMERFLLDVLTDSSKKDLMDGVISSVMAKEKLTDVDKILSQVISGSILEEQGHEYYLEQENLKEPVFINNLSTGMKSFLILKMLIEKGCINEKDVLILDEPEIHLHPQWQIVYAELIVLLQKYFDLSVIITTHSPYFADAIDLFSKKHEIGDRVNYYLASVENGWAKMENVTENLELVYQKMATPVQILDTMRYELNND